jgi:hypothetical protein
MQVNLMTVLSIFCKKIWKNKPYSDDTEGTGDVRGTLSERSTSLSHTEDWFEIFSCIGFSLFRILL